MAEPTSSRSLALLRVQVRRLRWRLNLRVALEALIKPAWVAVTAWVFLRAVLPAHGLPAALLASLGACVAAVRIARMHWVSFGTAAVQTDRLADGGGLLLTRLERPVGEWDPMLVARMEALRLPS